MRHAEVAQLAEQLIRNQQIVGSSPIFSSIFAAILLLRFFCVIYAIIIYLLSNNVKLYFVNNLCIFCFFYVPGGKNSVLITDFLFLAPVSQKKLPAGRADGIKKPCYCICPRILTKNHNTNIRDRKRR